MSNSKRITVFLSASTKVAPVFLAAAEELGEGLARAGFEIVYGGANVGMMGRLADAALAVGGRVHGVVPEHDFMDGLVHQKLSSQKSVASLWERKSLMAEMADAFVVAPGGIGTLDEATDVLTLRQTGESTKPVIFLNLFDFWDPFLESLELMGEQGMLHGIVTDLYIKKSNCREIVEYLKCTL